MQEWKEYFMKLLERKKEEGKAETEMEKNQKEPEETEITVEEVERQMRKLKKKKAPGRDGVQNEVWMYGTKGILERMVELMNAVWREGIICSIYKKGEKNKAENYQGITLLLYASVLNERLLKLKVLN
jgi:hypothetical protein